MTYAQTAKMITDHRTAGNEDAAVRVFDFAVRAGKDATKLLAAIEKANRT